MIPYSALGNEQGQLPEVATEHFIARSFRTSGRTGNYLINTSTIQELKSTGMFSYLSQDMTASILQTVKAKGLITIIQTDLIVLCNNWYSLIRPYTFL